MSRVAQRGTSVGDRSRAVSEPDAEPDVECDMVLQQSRERGSTMRFASVSHGDSLHLSADRLSAHHVSSAEEAMYGVVLSERPLEETADGFYFELSIDAIQEDKTGGLAIGVTATRPADMALLLPGLPEAAVEVPSCWCIGFYGVAFSSEHGDFTDVPWDPQLLSLGDRVGLHLTANGTMSIMQNGQVVARSPDEVPIDCPLYAVVDLFGNTAGVSIIPDATAASPSWEPAVASYSPRPRSNGSSISRPRIISGSRRGVGRAPMSFHVPSCATDRRNSIVTGFKPDRPVPPRPSVRRASVQIPIATSQPASRISHGYLNVPVASTRSRSTTRTFFEDAPHDVEEYSTRRQEPVIPAVSSLERSRPSTDKRGKSEHKKTHETRRKENKENREEQQEKCSICLEQLRKHRTPNGSVRCLPCCHVFHNRCIDRWLLHNSTCPMCRSDIS